MKIIVASQNPVKIEAVKTAFFTILKHNNFEIHGINAASGVSDQPLSDSETLQGARQRAMNAKNSGEKANYYIGIEGGLQKTDSEYQAFAWIVITNGEICGKAKTGTFVLPARVSELINKGYELGDADDIVFGHTNSKQKNGAVGILTKNTLTRSEYYSTAVILAFISFLNPDLYT